MFTIPSVDDITTFRNNKAKEENVRSSTTTSLPQKTHTIKTSLETTKRFPFTKGKSLTTLLTTKRVKTNVIKPTKIHKLENKQDQHDNKPMKSKDKKSKSKYQCYLSDIDNFKQCYDIVSAEKKEWTEAKKYCQKIGMYLITGLAN